MQNKIPNPVGKTPLQPIHPEPPELQCSLDRRCTKINGHEGYCRLSMFKIKESNNER